MFDEAACQKEAWPTHKLICTSPRPAVVASAGGKYNTTNAAVEKKEDEKKEDKKKPTNPQDQASFFDAVKKGTLNKARLKTLLAKNIDIDGEDAKGYTASLYCIGRNDVAMLELLVGNGANINWKDKDGLTLLHGACQFGHEKLVSFLIAKGADKDAQTNKRGLHGPVNVY